jgi:hypothetical protein
VAPCRGIRPGLPRWWSLVSCLGFGLLAQSDLAVGISLLWQLMPLAVLAPVAFVLASLLRGPAEIRHAEWECLDIG